MENCNWKKEEGTRHRAYYVGTQRMKEGRAAVVAAAANVSFVDELHAPGISLR